MWPFLDINYILLLKLFSKLMFFINDDDMMVDSISVKEYNFSPYQLNMTNALIVNMFPDQFYFGVSTSAYQTEGAWNEDGKGESVWDHLTHSNPSLIRDRSNADIAADSYHHYKTDINIAKQIGSNIYKISISWPRIFPDGLHSPINMDGIRHYNTLINEIIANKMIPMVTLFHWDMPYSLQKIGGLSNPLIINFLIQYAWVAFDAFGDRVKYWVTINEPSVICHSYGSDAMIPALNLSGKADYICGHNLLLAHANIYEFYQQQFSDVQKGKVGIVLNLKWFEPENPKNVEDQLAAERAFQWWNGWFLNPLFSEQGGYPEMMKTIINNRSFSEHLNSRLPNFEFFQLQQVKNSADFLGISFDKNTLVRDFKPNSNDISFENDAQIKESSIQLQEKNYKKIKPQTLAYLLNRIDLNYELPPIIITEIGYQDDGKTQDLTRSIYHHEHLSIVLQAMKNGIDIRGYLVRSFIDSFEWMMGYTVKSGIFSVDFADKNRTRRARVSAAVISDVYKKKLVRKLKDIYGHDIRKI